MSRIRLMLLAALGAAFALAAPAGAQAPEDVRRVESAVTELGNAKRAAAGKVAAGERAGAKALRSCESGSPGWKRIGAVRVPAQRSLYRRGAKTLWRELNEVAMERAALDAYRAPFERFVNRFERPLADPVLQAGVEAWRKRIAYYEAATGFGTCRAFEKLLKPVRQFDENVRADYLAGDIYNKMVRFVSDGRRKAAARHWGSRHDAALRAARARLVALGGDEGYATFFAFGHSLRG
ncbi:MAG TPA: hypothetical protein VGW14_09940 [Thermoleophilaceae bacterium]|nr:hypothetical protein [Thermoleophilaceae bacterium]